MTIEGDKITFSSGRTAFANCGIVGISRRLNVTAGYDNGLWNDQMDEDDTDLTRADLIELADYMIGCWRAFQVAIRARSK